MKHKGLCAVFAKKFTIYFVFFLLSFGLLNSVVFAQTGNPPTDDEVNAVAKELYCPVCENTSLDVCPTQACAQWRTLIKEKLIAGWDKEEIKQYFVDQYGDRVLAEPPRTGLNWIVYILPPVLFSVGIYLVYINLRKVRKITDLTDLKPALEDDPYLQKVESALKALEESDRNG
jgi:cytochrome c-type biogenesis protein CcmH